MEWVEQIMTGGIRWYLFNHSILRFIIQPERLRISMQVCIAISVL
jgi:hypothetical protein